MLPFSDLGVYIKIGDVIKALIVGKYYVRFHIHAKQLEHIVYDYKQMYLSIFERFQTFHVQYWHVEFFGN